MSGRLEWQGQGASPGTARGPAYVLAGVDVAPQRPLPAGGDARRLLAAVELTVDRLRALAGSFDLQSGAILEFQIEMLKDPAILEPGLARIRAGDDAVAAWTAAMDDYIHGFEASDDEHIRARSGDMLDIRNQVLRALNGEAPPDFPTGSVFVGGDIAPSLFLAHDWSGGGAIALAGGSAASHVAMLARSRGIPMVVGLGETAIESGTELFVDGSRGLVMDGAGAPERENGNAVSAPAPSPFRPEAPECRTADGIAVMLRANIDHPADLRGLPPHSVGGIGLFRTEYLMTAPGDFADEERQLRLYSQVLAWADGRPVTIRLFDYGADKPMPGEEVDPRSHLGLRGIRLLLARQSTLRVQIRALLRAAPLGHLQVLVPVVTSPAELNATAAILAEEAGRLAAQGLAHAVPPLGIMIEVPAAALAPESFGRAAFFSFGTNDLGQYLAAAARDDAAVSHLHADAKAATLRFLRYTAPLALATGKPVSLCGDLATDADALPDLLACGFRDFSMPPARMALARAALSRLNADGSKARD